MTGTEVAVHRAQASAIPAKLAYANELANSGLLPAAYRRNPANVLWGVEFAEMLGLPPMAAFTGVHVIEGKPSASAGLISALVRRAGHKLRVRGDSHSAVCQIVRSDDPDYTFEVTWTLRKNGDGHPSAEEAGLLGKDVWKKYPASMLKSRAITQCARDACEEALFGLHYTAEELGAEVDEDGAIVGVVVDEGQQDAPAEDPWYVHPAPEEDSEWAAAALRVIPSIGLEACRKMWPEALEKGRSGEDRPGATKVLNALTARMEELKPAEPPADAEPIEGVIVTPDEDAEAAEALAAGSYYEKAFARLDPEDDWTEKVKDLASRDDLPQFLADVDRTRMKDEKRRNIRDAALAKFPDSGQVAA